MTKKWTTIALKTETKHELEKLYKELIKIATYDNIPKSQGDYLSLLIKYTKEKMKENNDW